MASEPGKCCWVHNGLKQETPVTSVSEARESRRPSWAALAQGPSCRWEGCGLIRRLEAV